MSYKKNSVSSIRRECTKNLTSTLNGLTEIPQRRRMQYAKKLEEHIYKLVNEPKCVWNIQTVYYRHYNRILTILKLNPHITLTYNPFQLLMENDYKLVEEVGVKNYAIQYQEEYKAYKRLVYQQNHNAPDNPSSSEEQDESSLSCPNPKCRNTQNFRINLRQTRGADEPMTVFVTCPKCNRKFRR